MAGELLVDIKNYQDITWTDTELDKKLIGMIDRGKKYIDQIAGSSMDYEVEDKPRELLFEYVRYARANALDEFQTNYLPELLSLQIREEVKAYVAEENSDV